MKKFLLNKKQCLCIDDNIVVGNWADMLIPNNFKILIKILLEGILGDVENFSCLNINFFPSKRKINRAEIKFRYGLEKKLIFGLIFPQTKLLTDSQTRKLKRQSRREGHK